MTNHWRWTVDVFFCNRYSWRESTRHRTFLLFIMLDWSGRSYCQTSLSSFSCGKGTVGVGTRSSRKDHSILMLVTLNWNGASMWHGIICLRSNKSRRNWRRKRDGDGWLRRSGWSILLWAIGVNTIRPCTVTAKEYCIAACYSTSSNVATSSLTSLEVYRRECVGSLTINHTLNNFSLRKK
jgi:hypothetical protein